MIKLIKSTDPKAKAAAKNKPPMAIDQAISNYLAFARKHHGMTSTEAVAAVSKFYDNLPGAIVDADIEIGKQRKVPHNLSEVQTTGSALRGGPFFVPIFYRPFSQQGYDSSGVGMVLQVV